MGKRKNSYVTVEAAVETRAGPSGERRKKKNKEPHEEIGVGYDEETDEEPLKKTPRRKAQIKELIQPPPETPEEFSVSSEDGSASESEEEEENSNNFLSFRPDGVLDKKKFGEEGERLRKSAASLFLSTQMQRFPYITIGKQTHFTAQFSPIPGKTCFYFWRGKSNDDFLKIKTVYKLTEGGFSNLLRHRAEFSKWCENVEEYRQKVEAGIIKEKELETRKPPLPDPVTLETTKKGPLELSAYFYNAGVGGGVSLRYSSSIGGEFIPAIGFTPGQYINFIQMYYPLINNISTAVDKMFDEIRVKEKIKNLSGTTDYWKTGD